MAEDSFLIPKVVIHALSGFIFSLAACQYSFAKTVVPAPVAQQRPAWQMPEDLEAKAYLSSCETDFKRAAAELDSFTGLKSVSHTALLDKLNNMDIILDRQLSRAGLYSSQYL